MRTGRANVNALDRIRVPYYGQPTPLNQVAQLAVPEPRMITIKPWEKNMLKEIERAIQTSDLGINPSNDGKLIRLVFPDLTEERRKKLAKVVKDNGEKAKVAVRNARRDANSTFDELEKESEITEDDLHRSKANVQTLTNAAIAKVDEIVGKKQAELQEI